MTQLKLGVSTLMVLAVIAVAGYEGGPKAMDDPHLSRLIGADPSPGGGDNEAAPPPAPQQKCNTKNTYQKQCPIVGFQYCGPDYTKRAATSSGQYVDKRYDEGGEACTRLIIGCPTTYPMYDKDGGPCIPQVLP